MLSPPPGSAQRRPSAIRFLLLACILVLIGGGAIWFWRSVATPVAAGRQGLVVIDAAAPAGQPTSLATLLPAEGNAQGIQMPDKIRSALGLLDAAVIRDTRVEDPPHEVICGEVSRDGSAEGFRRFVYVGIARTGQIDDGSIDFEQYRAAVCKPHPNETAD